MTPLRKMTTEKPTKMLSSKKQNHMKTSHESESGNRLVSGDDLTIPQRKTEVSHTSTSLHTWTSSTLLVEPVPNARWSTQITWERVRKEYLRYWRRLSYIPETTQYMCVRVCPSSQYFETFLSGELHIARFTTSPKS